jgi:hypothetical protein
MTALKYLSFLNFINIQTFREIDRYPIDTLKSIRYNDHSKLKLNLYGLHHF